MAKRIFLRPAERGHIPVFPDWLADADVAEGRHMHDPGSTEPGIAIGERALWDEGYGSETVRLLLDFAFGEWRLQRVHLHVFAGNARPIHVDERLGFSLDGVERGASHRHGRHHRVHLIGNLVSEWATQDQARTWTPDWSRAPGVTSPGRSLRPTGPTRRLNSRSDLPTPGRWIAARIG
jgi:hypothetical protein